MAAVSSTNFLLAKSAFKVVSVVLCAVILLPLCKTSAESSTKDIEWNFESLYNEGKEAYYEERWAECVAYMLKSLEDYKFFRRNVVHCRLSCRTESASLVKSKQKDIGDHLDMLYLHGSLLNSDCVRRCRKKLFGKRRDVIDQGTLEAFESLEPYNFLQLCFYKTENIKQAAKAAYTFFLGNPGHTVMMKNIYQYRALPEIKDSDFVNLEEPKHIELYLKGVMAYEKGDWIEEIDVMEKGVQAFYAAHEECGAWCEGPFDHQGLPDFHSAIADHYINVLKCKERCTTKLSTLYGKPMPSLLSDYYHYLQYAYFQAGDVKSAAQCVGTFLMYNPGDETMRMNKKLYLTLGLVEERFKPRDNAHKFLARKVQEEGILDLVKKGHYMSANEDDEADGVTSEINFKPIPVGDKVHDLGKLFLGDGNGNGARYKNGNGGGFKGYMDYLAEKQGVAVTITDRLDTNERIMGDGLLKEEDCGELINAAMMGGLPREGVRELKRNEPYPEGLPREIIQFLRADRLAEVVKIGKLKKEALQLYLNVAHLLREIIEVYSNITDENLYFRDLRLLCRKIYNKQPDETHKLEEICVLQEDGLCLTDDYWNDIDYHGILYLNDGQVGGTADYFIPGGGIKKTVSPQCGRFVIHSPKKNVHNVHPISRGSRCVMSMALTTDKSIRDLTVIKAEYLLREIEYLETTAKDTHYSDGMMEFYQSRGITVTLNPEDLRGEERFAADGLANKEQCETLVKLAQVAATPDDGYELEDDTTPGVVFTENEVFSGLTLGRAAELAEQNTVDADAVRLYLNLSELTKEITQNYFKLDTPLYFDYTHLVCRTAVNEEVKNRTDLSHPVHSDNCLIQKDGTCRKELPAYIQRDYSALLYLNNNFEGGEFFFTDNKLQTVSQVHPTCGRMVGFNAGIYHGVMPVLKGHRCAIAMWYTLDPFYKESARIKAKKILKNLKSDVKKPEGPHHDHGGEL